MKKGKMILLIICTAVIFIVFSAAVYAEPGVNITTNGIHLNTSDKPQDFVDSIKIFLLLSILSLAPSILIMMTSFTRIIIVLSFLRNALGTQQMPPNQVMVGLALFLTFFIMSPIVTQINNQAVQPYANKQISQQDALDKSSKIIRNFMYKHTRPKDLALFVSMSGAKGKVDKEKLSLTVVTPAFMISELKTAFQMGFIIYIPFLIIDMVVASTLMSMGMMMVPPVMISLPFKILLFIMVDGWNLITQSILTSFAK